MNLRKGKYTTNTSDLVIIVFNVAYQNDRYAKAKIRLVNKHNGIEYDMRPRYHKIYKHRITHWKRYYEPWQTTEN